MTYETDPEALSRLHQVEARLDALWALPVHLGVIEWGQQIELTTGNRKGPWRPDPYQVELLEAATDPRVRRVTYMKPAQVGWSLVCQIILLYAADHLGLNTLHIWPSQDGAAKFGKDRLEPMIDSIPSLRDRLIKPTAKNPGSTTRHKKFSNGSSIFLASAGNARELRGFEAGLMIFDERSAWKVDLGGEGNPARIAEARGKTHPDLKIFEGSTPGALPKGLDPTQISFERGSRGRWSVPCPHCNTHLRLQWRDPISGEYLLKFERQGANEREVMPGSVSYLCTKCGCHIEERQKWAMSQAGIWVHDYPERVTHRSFHMTALSSVAGDPWELLAQQWLDAQDDPAELKTFITLNLGEPWEDRGDHVTPDTLRARADRETRDRGVVSNGVGLLCCFVDVQGQGSGHDGYLYATILGFGPDRETWLVDWTIEPGDVSDPELWAALDRWILEPRFHETSGRPMRVAITLVDSGSGSHAEAVYSYAQPRQGAHRRVFASKGVPYIDRPGLVKEGTARKARVRLWNLSNAAWKQMLFGMLQRTTPGPGYIHLAHWVTDQFLDELTAESFVVIQDPKTRQLKGEWKKTKNRNEAWDCFGGCLCGLWILQNLLAPGIFKDLKRLADEAASPPGDQPTQVTAPMPVPSRASSGGLGGGLGGVFGGSMGRGFRGGL